MATLRVLFEAPQMIENNEEEWSFALPYIVTESLQMKEIASPTTRILNTVQSDYLQLTKISPLLHVTTFDANRLQEIWSILD